LRKALRAANTSRRSVAYWGCEKVIGVPRRARGRDHGSRRIKLRAIHRNQKLKDAIAQLLEAGIATASESEAPARAPKPVRLKKHRPLTIDDIEAAIAAGRE
jgi:hypothetical protein